VLAHVLADRLQEMRLAEPCAAVDEERVVGLGRRFGDCERGGVREAVDEPITNESNVYFWLISKAGRGAGEAGVWWTGPEGSTSRSTKSRI
jgi:hypothetical protein